MGKPAEHHSGRFPFHERRLPEGDPQERGSEILERFPVGGVFQHNPDSAVIHDQPSNDRTNAAFTPGNMHRSGFGPDTRLFGLDHPRRGLRHQTLTAQTNITVASGPHKALSQNEGVTIFATVVRAVTQRTPHIGQRRLS